MKKRFLAIILALCMTLALLPSAAFAEEPTSGTCGENLTWKLENGTLTISGTGKMQNYGYGDGHWAPWHSERTAIYSVVISDGVTSIGSYALHDCSFVTSVTIPNSVTSIENEAFGNCRSLINLTIPEGVSNIDTFAFFNCVNLTNVAIPDSVTRISSSAFYLCSGLKNVYYSGSKAQWEAAVEIDASNQKENGYLASATIHYNYNDTMPEMPNKPIYSGEFGAEGDNLTWSLQYGILTISGTGEMGNLSVHNSTRSSAPWEIIHGAIYSVVINDGVADIGSSAFAGCEHLTNITIPNSVTSIGNYAFEHCDGLTNVTIPDSVTSIGDGAFYGCWALTSVTIPDSVTDIDGRTFADCRSLTSVTLPNSITTIRGSTFNSCRSLTNITIPNSVTYIEGLSFCSCTNLTSITIPSSVTSIGMEAFFGTHLKDIYYGGTQAQWSAIETINGAGGSFFVYFDNATIHFNSTGPEQPAKPATTPAQPTNDKLSVDGQDATPAAYKIGGANFFMLRDVAMLLNGTKAQFEISYDNDKKAINITTGKAYTPQGYELKTTPQPNATAEASSDAVYIDGEKVELTAYKIGGANFYGIRDLGRALGFNVDWTRERGMFIESDKPYSGT